ncbi:MAG: hypothetical protein JW969_19870 [Spirochaetales bacterium]|nr:hypothetical protein [Spirochaetales bacterium]
MDKNRTKQYWDKYASEAVRIDAFVIRKLGLLQTQTVLRIGKFSIISAPLTISMQKAVLFVILSKNELNMLRPYQNNVHLLRFAFQPKDRDKPLKFFVYTTISRIEEIKDKENVCMVEVVYKNTPEDLINIIGQFLDIQKKLKNQYTLLGENAVSLNNESAQQLQVKRYLQCNIASRMIEVKILSLSVNHFTLLIPAINPNIKEGFIFASRLFMNENPLNFKGKITKVLDNKSGFLKVRYSVTYNPEYVDAIQHFIRDTQTKAS